MYRNHQNSTNANLSMLRCSPYFETSIRHVMLLLKTVCPRSVLPKASIFQVVIPSSFIKKKTPFLPCHQNPIQTPEWKKSYLVIQKLPSIALSKSVRTKLHDHNRNSRNDQENKPLIPYYKKIIPIPPSFFCTLLFGVSVFSFFYFLPLHVLHLDHDKNKRKKVCASADAVITNMWCQTNPETKKSPRISVRGHDRSTSSSSSLPAIIGRRSGATCRSARRLWRTPHMCYRVRGVHLCGFLANLVGCKVAKRRECKRVQKSSITM